MGGMNNADFLFNGRHFDRFVIILCVRWYVTHKPSYRGLVDMMAGRVLSMAHTTIMRWVLRYARVFEQRWRKYAKPVGRFWRLDETYIKVKGEWVYLYRAVDKQGATVDFYLSAQRDVAAAKRFLKRAIVYRGEPKKITLDGYAASHRAVDELKADEEL